jgi:hypothetical protein
MRAILTALTLFLVTSLALADEKPKAKKKPQAEDFVGVWQGQWDGKFKVQFQFTPGKNKDELTVEYWWEEHVGRGLQRDKGPFTATVDNGVLKMGKTIEILRAPDKPDKARAYGHFAAERTADLVRVGKEKAWTEEKPENGLIGSWEGTADGVSVLITLTPGVRKDLMTVDFQSSINGQRALRMKSGGSLVDGVLKVAGFEIMLAANDPHRAKVTGKFDKERTIELKLAGSEAKDK